MLTKFTFYINYFILQILLNSNLTNVNIYVSDDGKLHFVDSEGADSVLPFNGKKEPTGSLSKIGYSGSTNQTTNFDISKGDYHHIAIAATCRQYNNASIGGFNGSFKLTTDGEILSSPQNGQTFDEVYTFRAEWFIKGGTYAKLTTGHMNGHNWDLFKFITNL